MLPRTFTKALPIFLLLIASCSEDETESPLFTPGVGVTDVDGNTYTSIVLGEQEWMSQNLKTSKYSNGDAIPNVTDATWGSITTGGWCYYNNDASNHAGYGKLYNWYAVTDTRKICPAGWHIPDDFDWAKLATYLGGMDVAGGKMKEASTTHWNPPNTGATNLSGFNGLPGGNRRGAINSLFETFGTLGRFWSASQLNTDAAWGYDLTNAGTSVGRNQFNKTYGFSCRCIRE